MTTRNKMYRSNSLIRKYLEVQGFHSFYFFPHLRFMKDYNFEGCEFDALGWKNGDTRLWLFQFKTNKACPKKELEKYDKIKKKFNCIPCWVSTFNRTNKIKKYKGIKIVKWY